MASAKNVPPGPPESQKLGEPVPLAFEVAGWYGTLAILGAYAGVSWGLFETGVTYQLLNLTGAVGIGLVCWRRRVWQPLVLQATWAIVAIAALAILSS